MEIKSLRWGYDGGGMACFGPVEGNSIAEITAMDEAGRLVFSMVSSNGEGIDFMICDVPVFDIMINLADDEVDFAGEFGKVRGHAAEEYLCAWGENVPVDLISSKHKDLLSLTFAALDHYMHTPVEEEVSEEEFIKGFVDESGNMVNVPEIDFGEYDD